MQSRQDKMEVDIINEAENSLFNRKEITASVKSESSPKREDVMVALAEKYSTEVDNVKIKGIKGNFGSNEYKVKANIYSSKEEKENVEGKKKKDQEIEKKREEEKKAAEQPKEESSDEKQEESSEENKEEKSE